MFGAVCDNRKGLNEWDPCFHHRGELSGKDGDIGRRNFFWPKKRQFLSFFSDRFSGDALFAELRACHGGRTRHFFARGGLSIAVSAAPHKYNTVCCHRLAPLMWDVE